MYQYYTVEIKKDKDGNFEHTLHWHYDEDNEQARLKGEAKFHEILSRAATSYYAEHAAILFSSQGKRIMDMCYIHTEKEEVTENAES